MAQLQETLSSATNPAHKDGAAADNSSESWYSGYYESGWRWVEDTYLKYFGENRASYGVKDTLSKTEITGNKDVDGIQEGVYNAVGNTLGSNGLAGGVGDALDKNVLRGNV